MLPNIVINFVIYILFCFYLVVWFIFAGFFGLASHRYVVFPA
jgi:hypothetical protein